jgi:dihydrofolate reductase
MRKLTFGMNLSLDGYIAAPGDDLGWSVPSDELFQWWSDRVGATGLALYGRKLWETMSSHWPTADQQPGATPAQIEFARRWRDMPKVVFSSTTITVDWNTRLVTADAVTEITRLKADDRGGHAGRADRRVRDRHPSGPGGRRHAVLHCPGQPGEPEPGGDPDVSRRRAPDQVRNQALNTRPRISAGFGPTQGSRGAVFGGES